MIYGNLKNVAGYEQFNPSAPEQQSGHFLVLDLASEGGATIQTKIIGGDSEDWVTVDDGFCVYRIKNTQQKIVVKTTKTEQSTERTYDLSNLILE